MIPIPQKEEESSYAPMIKKEMGRILWGKEAEELERMVRGMNSWPSAYTTYGKKTLKIWEAFVEEGDSGMSPGSVAKVTKDAIKVQTGKNLLVLKNLQLEGKKRMDASAFLLGNKVEAGDIMGH